MFVGHYSASIVAKAVSPKTPFWVLLISAQFVDVFWAIFILSGLEKVKLDPELLSNPLDLYYMPFTHSLAATFFWAIFAFVLVRYIPNLKFTFKQGLIVSCVVASHWVLDLIVHRPDLLVYDEIKVGFGLWDFPMTELIIEIALVVLSVLYLCNKVSFSPTYKRRMIYFGVLLILLQLSSVFGPIPQSVHLLVLASLFIYIGLAFVGFFSERNTIS